VSSLLVENLQIHPTEAFADEPCKMVSGDELLKQPPDTTRLPAWQTGQRVLVCPASIVS
jgi:hypothetical protein